MESRESWGGSTSWGGGSVGAEREEAQVGGEAGLGGAGLVPLGG